MRAQNLTKGENPHETFHEGVHGSAHESHPARLDLLSSQARPDEDTPSSSELSTPGVAA